MCEGQVTVFGGERGEIQFNSIQFYGTLEYSGYENLMEANKTTEPLVNSSVSLVRCRTPLDRATLIGTFFASLVVDFAMIRFKQ